MINVSFSTDHNLLSISPASYNALLDKKKKAKKLSLKKTELIPRYYQLVNLSLTSMMLLTAEKTMPPKGGSPKYGLLYKKFKF